jgi:hypothetical protein
MKPEPDRKEPTRLAPKTATTNPADLEYSARHGADRTGAPVSGEGHGDQDMQLVPTDSSNLHTTNGSLK